MTGEWNGFCVNELQVKIIKMSFVMAIKKGKHSLTLSDKEFQKKKNLHELNWNSEAGIDPKHEQLNNVPKKTEEWQNVDEGSKLPKNSMHNNVSEK